MDSGLSGRELERRLRQAGLSPRSLTAILVSHEHRDHTAGVGVAARRFNRPVYMNERTWNSCRTVLGKIESRPFETGQAFNLGPINIHPFSVAHDAADPVGFRFTCNGTRLGLVTDLGTPTNLVKTHMAGCHGLIIESNHDPQMLMEGPYPWDLKRRVRGRKGHLSNIEAAKLLSELAHGGLKQVVLAHLSETNNKPELALSEAGSSFPHASSDFSLEAASQDAPSPVFNL